MITNQLLIEVLGFKDYNIELHKIEALKYEPNMITIHQSEMSHHGHVAPCSNEMNLHELANKCKQWALTKGYYIYSSIGIAYIKDSKTGEILVYLGEEDDELQTVFDAGQWTLNHLEGEP